MPIHRAMMLKAITVVCCLPLATCGQHATERQSVVLFERGEKPLRVELATWKGDAPWLITLDEGEKLTVRNASGSAEVKAEPGQMLVVSPALRIHSYTLGTVVAPDQIRVNGSKEAAEELAGLLDATVESDGTGGWGLVGDELFERTSFLAPPQGISSIEPRYISRPSSWVVDASATLGEAERFARFSAGERMAAVVGLYSLRGEHLLLNASGEYQRLVSTGVCAERESAETGRYVVDGDGDITFVPVSGGSWQVHRDDTDGSLVSASGHRYVAVEQMP